MQNYFPTLAGKDMVLLFWKTSVMRRYTFGFTTSSHIVGIVLILLFEATEHIIRNKGVQRLLLQLVYQDLGSLVGNAINYYASMDAKNMDLVISSKLTHYVPMKIQGPTYLNQLLEIAI
jgi:hypothetical protein